ncbi:MAG: hypothetical protein ACRYG6_13120 [Janthinobacterium lividum]
MASDPGLARDRAALSVEARAVEHPEPDPGRRALEAFDRVLAEKPDDDTPRAARTQLGHDFSETTRMLCGFRDILVQAQRRDGVTPASQARLQAVNGVLSTVLAGHFPLGDIPWAQVQTGREALARLLAEG